MNKRYAIVRVDNKCLSDYENIKCPYDYKCAKCKFGKLKNYNYGDTKEQMVMKVAQVIFKAKLERYRLVWKCECSEMEKRERYKGSLILAQKIVEFLGVEE